MREFYASARVVHIDGMPLIFLGKLLGFLGERRALVRVHHVQRIQLVRAKRLDHEILL